MPTTMTAIPTIRLKIGRRSTHPWIFEKMVERPAERLPPGSVVDVVNRGGEWVGRGFYNGHSRIRVRILTADPDEAVDEVFFARRIGAALEFRREALALDAVTDAYRVVHAEGDGLSGLMVDRYGSIVVVEFFSAGMYRFLPAIRSVLEDAFPGSDFYWFAQEHVQKQESIDCRAPDPPRPVTIREHGLKFRVAPGTGHKTGFFLDQRDNRRLLADLTRGKRVLDLCCNTGGFAVYAAGLGGAEEVVAVDLDEQAIELAGTNAGLNEAKIRLVRADLFPWLRDAIKNGERFDVVVLDPWKQTRAKERIDDALARYHDMNRLALHVVRPGGILVTCSCTGLVHEEPFLDALDRASRFARRPLQIFRVTGAAPDHLFQVHIPESRYLKVVWCRVL